MKFKSEVTKLSSEISGLEHEYKKLKGPSAEKVFKPKKVILI